MLAGNADAVVTVENTQAIDTETLVIPMEHYRSERFQPALTLVNNKEWPGQEFRDVGFGLGSYDDVSRMGELRAILP